jgi:hypothetical protein
MSLRRPCQTGKQHTAPKRALAATEDGHRACHWQCPWVITRSLMVNPGGTAVQNVEDDVHDEREEEDQQVDLYPPWTEVGARWLVHTVRVLPATTPTTTELAGLPHTGAQMATQWGSNNLSCGSCCTTGAYSADELVSVDTVNTSYADLHTDGTPGACAQTTPTLPWEGHLSSATI